jgi:uncharacterized protein (TIGR02996 family)
VASAKKSKRAKASKKNPANQRHPKGIPSHAELEAAIAGDPRADDAWLVFEDWMLETEDPRAPIVSAERKAPPKRDPWDKDHDVQDAYEKLRRRLLGEHPKWVLLKNRSMYSGWRAGHITKLSWSVRDDVALERELYAAMLATPAARLVYNANLHDERLLLPFVDILARSPAARSLRALDIGPHYIDDEPTMELDANVLAPFQIDELTTCWSTVLRAGQPLARLRSLDVSHRDHAATVKLFGDMVFPELRALKLATRKMTRDALAPLLPGTATPKLESLCLHDSSNRVARALVDELRSSQLLRQLRSLKLGYEPGKSVPESQTERVVPGSFLGNEFAHLEHLTVPRNY